MVRLSFTICVLLSFVSYSLASSCKEAKLCCVARDENCVVKKTTVNTVGESVEDKGCFCDLVCLKNGDCCSDFKETCGVESRPYRYHNMIKRATDTDDKDKTAAEKDDADDDYINEEGYEDDVMNDNEDDEDDETYDDDETSDAVPLVMVTHSTNITVAEGGSVWLHCAVQNGENAVLMWMKGDVLLYQNEMVTDDKRFFIYKNNTLAVTDLKKSDYGSYTCSVIDTTGKKQSVVHRLLYPQAPRVVQMLPMDRERFVPEGKPLKIQCLVTGIPKPKITWSREGSRLTDDNASFEDQTLYIRSVDRHDSGKYQCLATNGIGTPAVGKVVIKVLHAPEVHVKKSVVNTDEGYEAVMLCTVKSDPRSTIVWEKNNELIHDSHHHHINMDDERKHSTLRILKVTSKDFGKYTCKATNQYGRGEGHVILVKQPGRAMWVSGDQDVSDAPVLQWAVESVQPITDVELRYVKVDQSKPNVTAREEEWIIVKPDIAQPTGNVYTVKHALSGLTPGKYAAQVRAKNTHGWSELSDQHYFDGAFEDNDVLSPEVYENVPAVAGIRTATGGAKSIEISSTTTLILSAVTCVLVRIL